MKKISLLLFSLFSSMAFANEFVFDVGHDSPFVRLIENDHYHPEMHAGLVLEHTYANYISIACKKDSFTGKNLFSVNGVAYALYTDLNGEDCASELRNVFSSLKSGKTSKVSVSFSESSGRFIFRKITVY
ncbi:MAG: hypothetical protein JNL11_01515 [Bdellovibrionaceae bacterium]|nr:hypothetical protein [Pseudobdellovibrionaceae bacterium]